MEEPSKSTTDVVIIGAGPSGRVYFSQEILFPTGLFSDLFIYFSLMAGLWMARCGVKARIIDIRATKVFRGHADGMQTGTLDIFDSFDILDELYKKAAPAVESTFWVGDRDGSVKRVARFPKWHPGLGNTERALLDGMKAFNKLEVERGVAAVAIDIDDSIVQDPQAHAIKLTVKHLTDEELAASSNEETIPQPGDFNYNPADEPYMKRTHTGKEGTTEVINAKFVIGTDGSRSWTRNALGFDFVGDEDDQADESIGGILDCVATSNFPDIHVQSYIIKDGRGAGFVPREDGLLRLAAPVANRSEATPEAIIKSIKEIISPYELHVTRVDWVGVFGTRRRVSSSPSKYSRVFLAGDALHVHSPRAGIGMNFSMQDAYNLGWKIAHVVQGISPLSILKTYDEERGLTTDQLIAFDKALSAEMQITGNFSLKGAREELQANLSFSSTTAIEYETGLLVANEGGTIVSKQHLAPGIRVGRRLTAQPVENHASGNQVDFAKCFPSDGRYRIVIFAGNISKPEQLRRVKQLSQVLELPEAFLRHLDRRAITLQEVFQILVVHTASRDDVEITDLPQSLFKNRDPSNFVFVDNNETKTWVA
ncbi:hypothetical protein EsH8_IV_001446 [Colletotrichum jinshuiense]